MRVIDADPLVQSICQDQCGHPRETSDSYCEGCEMIAYITAAPTLDAVPVVRCKDCVYLGCVQCALANEYNQYRPGVDPDWFCAKGRRRKVCG